MDVSFNKKGPRMITENETQCPENIPILCGIASSAVAPSTPIYVGCGVSDARPIDCGDCDPCALIERGNDDR